MAWFSSFRAPRSRRAVGSSALSTDRRVTRAARFTVEALERRVLLTALPSTVHASADAQYVISGDATSGYAVTLSAGTFSFDDSVGATGNVWQNLSLTVTGSATLALNTQQTFSSLTLSGSAKVIDTGSGGGWQGTSNHLSSGNLLIIGPGGLSFTNDPNTGLPSATLDLGDNDMILQGAGAAYATQLRTMLRRSRGSSWAGPGLTSSAVAAALSSPARTALGYGLNDGSVPGIHYSVFDSVNVAASDVLVKYTLVGDTNLDGLLNNADFTRFSNAYNAYAGQATSWGLGDFDYDGRTTNADFTLFSNNFGQVLVGPNLARTILPSAQPITAVEGQPFSGTVATFTDTLNTASSPNTTTVGSYTASISWGDGNFLSAAVAPDTNPNDPGGFIVIATSPNALTNPDALIVAEVQYTAASGFQGRPGALGEPLQVILPAVSNLTATTAPTGEIDLSWALNASNASAIEVDRSNDGGVSFPAVATVSGSATSYADSAGLSPGTDYLYEVRAIQNNVPSAPAGPAAASTAPAAPTSLTVAPTGSDQVSLSWANTAASVQGYTIQRSSDGGATFTSVATLGGDATGYVDGGLDGSTQYIYQIGAFNSGGTSYSTQTVTTLPAAPDLGLHYIDQSSVTLWWTGFPYVGITGYKIDRSYDGTAFTYLTTVGAPNLSYVDTTVQAGTDYYYRIRAIGAAGDSDYSNIVKTTTSPAAALNVVATAVSGTEIDLTWTNASQSVDGLSIERRPVGGSFTRIDTVAGTVTSYRDSGLHPGERYYYRVSNSADVGDASPDVDSATTYQVVGPQVAYNNTGLTSPQPSGLSLTTALPAGSNWHIDWGDGQSSDVAGSGSYPVTSHPYTQDSNNVAITSTLTIGAVTSPLNPLYIKVIDKPSNPSFPSGLLATHTQTGGWQAAQHDPTQPGAPVYADSDPNGIGIPDFANGFSATPTSPPVTPLGHSFLYVSIAWPSNTIYSNAKVQFQYDASDPAAVSRTGSGTSADPYVYTPAPGTLRLWSGDGTGQRTAAAWGTNPSQMGYYLPPDVALAATAAQNYLTSFYVEAVGATTSLSTRKILVSIDPTGNGNWQSDYLYLTARPFDVSIDSNNATQPGVTNSDGTSAELPVESPAVDKIQDDPTRYGKIVVVNDADKNHNGIPDFADGYSFSGIDDSASDGMADAANPQEHFVPIVLTVPPGSTDPISIGYPASDPRRVVGPTSADPTRPYEPAPGNLRLWTKVGSIQDGSGFTPRTLSDYVDPSRTYTPQDLGVDANGKIVLYVEAVRASANPGDLEIDAWSGTITPGQPFLGYIDKVRLTAMQDAPMVYNDPANVLGGTATGSDGGDPAALGFSGPVRLADGTVSTAAVTDLSSDGFGQNFGITRVWTDQLGLAYHSMVGNGWVISDLPYLIQADGTVVEVADGKSARFFDYDPTDLQHPYKPRFFIQDSLAYASDTYTLVDTKGNQIQFYGFGPNVDASLQGRFKKLIDPSGNITQTAYAPAQYGSYSRYQLASVNRSNASASETWSFQWSVVDPTDPYSRDQLQSVTLSRSGNGQSGNVENASYTYYTGAVGESGNNGDLESVDISTPSAGTIASYYYRYYHPSGKLMLALGPAGFARALAANIDPFDLTQANALPSYADEAFFYDQQGRVQGEYVPGLDGSPLTDANGNPIAPTFSGMFANVTFDYSTNPSYPGSDTIYLNSGFGTVDSSRYGIDTWSHGTQETDGGGLGFSITTTFLNYAGEILVSSVRPVDAADPVTTFYAYDPQGRMVLHAMPSAVEDFNPKLPDLMGGTGNNHYDLLNAHSGLIDLTTYYNGTDGGPAGYLKDQEVKQGDQGTPDVLHTTEYTSHEDSVLGQDITIHPVAVDIAHAVQGDAGQFTFYNYNNWAANSVQPRQVQTLYPVVAPARNGTGQSDPGTSYFDTYGRLQFTQDALGYIDFLGYDDSTGAVATDIVDANLQNLPAGVVVPTGLSRPSTLAAPLALETDTKVDAFGRPLKVVDPQGNVTYYVYLDYLTDGGSYDSGTEVRTYPGWHQVPGTSLYTTTGPIQVVRDDWSTGVQDALTVSSNLQGFTSASPLASDNVFGASYTLQSLTRKQTDYLGFAVTSDSYANFNGVAYSDLASHSQVIQDDTQQGTGQTAYYYRTTYVYGDLGQLVRVMDPVGTITYTNFDEYQRPQSVWIGSNDAGWWRGVAGTAASNNMVKVRSYEYDNGTVGDGNLTKVTTYPHNGADRVTTNFYDWRDRLVATEQATGATGGQYPINYSRLDNLGRTTASLTFQGPVANIGIGTDGVPQQPDSSLLRAETEYVYDPRGQLYQTLTHSINQTNGNDQGTLSTTNAYNARGDLIASAAPGGLVMKSVYDGAGRPSVQYMTDNAGGDLRSVSGDHVLTQTEFNYDNNGNLTTKVTKDRFDAVVLGGAGPAGPLTSADARVSYVLNWYDQANRLTESVNYGTNGGSAPSPSSAPARANADGWDPYLVTTFGYSPAGYLDDTADPRGVHTKQYFNALGEVTQSVQGWTGQAYSAFLLQPTLTSQVTFYSYDGLGRLRFQHVRSASSTDGGQTAGPTVTNSIEYRYQAGSLSNTPSQTLYRQPDTGQSANDPSLAAGNTQADRFDALGEITWQSDRSGAQHAYAYDSAGRQVKDSVVSFPNLSNQPNRMDTTIDEHVYAYDSLGRLVDASGDRRGQIKNDDKRVYDGLGNLTDDKQDHFGAVTTGTPDVHYTFDTSFGSNYSRLSAMTYPDGRVLNYNYNGNAGLDASISRVSSLSDGGGSTAGQVLESYTYLGLGTVVSRTLPQENAVLSYRRADAGGSVPQAPNGTPYNDAGASDPYTGLDRFGRVIDQNWFTIGGSTLDRHQYGYDADSNLLYALNLGNYGVVNGAAPVSAGQSELYQANGVAATTFDANGYVTGGAYDPLNRLTAYNLGTLGQGTGATRLNYLSGGLSPQPAWASSAQGNFQRSDVNADAQRPIVQGVFQPAALANSVTTPYSGQHPASALSLQYDAWGDLAHQQQWVGDQYVNSYTAARDTAYRYDALGRRISDGGTQLYYDASGNVIEEQTLINTGSGAQYLATAQYVRSAAGGNALVLRDRSTGTGGNLGTTNSGLGERLYSLQDPQSNVTAILGVGGSGGYVVERYLYTPNGQVTVLDANGVTNGNYAAASSYNWRYLFHAGRDDGGGLSYLGGVEMDALTGGPLKEDPHAYWAAKQAYSEWTAQNSEVTHDDPYHIAVASRWVGLAALAVATGGASVAAQGAAWTTVLGTGLTYAAEAGGAGAVYGFGDALIRGGDPLAGAAQYAQFGLAFAAGQGLLSKGAATFVNWGALIGGTGYGLYDAIHNEGNPVLAAYRGIAGAYFGMRMAGYRLNWGGGYFSEDGSYVLGSTRIFRKAAFTGDVYSVRINPAFLGRPDPRYSIDTQTFLEGDETSNGGIRNTREFWEQWLALRPESISSGNRFLIENYASLKVSPRIDQTWIDAIPEHAQFIEDTLLHHHVDFGRYAIPVPASTHVGSGGPWHVPG